MTTRFARTLFGIMLAALVAGVAGAGSKGSPRTGDVTIRVLGSSHDNGEIKPCG